MRRASGTFLATMAVAAVVAGSAPAPAAASVGSTVCGLTGLVSGVVGKACSVATHAGKVLGAGRKLLGGHIGGALGELTGAGTRAATAVGVAGVAAAVVLGARYLLRETAAVVGATTRPSLTSTWFSASYWRMASVAALLTLPFLFAAAVQAMMRSDLALLARAAFGYLPLALFSVGVAAPLSMLLLAGSDEMSAIVSSASGDAGLKFLTRAEGIGALLGLLSGTAFVPLLIALLTAAATLSLWVELILRDAAVYVIVLMLPLFFAAMVWPARRIWAIRAVELLVALILSKFAIVAVLTLGGAALGHATIPGPAAFLTGATLVMLATFSPWALMRLLPLHELAGAAMTGLRGGRISEAVQRADVGSDAADRLRDLPARLRDGLSPAGAADLAEPPSDPDVPAVATSRTSPEGGDDGVAPAGGGTEGEAAPAEGEPAPAEGGGAEGEAAPAEGEPAPADGGARPPLPDLFRAPSGSWRPMILGGPGAEEDARSDRPLLEPDPGATSASEPAEPLPADPAPDPPGDPEPASLTEPEPASLTEPEPPPPPDPQAPAGPEEGDE